VLQGDLAHLVPRHRPLLTAPDDGQRVVLEPHLGAQPRREHHGRSQQGLSEHHQQPAQHADDRRQVGGGPEHQQHRAHQDGDRGDEQGAQRRRRGEREPLDG
jgi:hypothetical protein